MLKVAGDGGGIAGEVQPLVLKNGETAVLQADGSFRRVAPLPEALEDCSDTADRLAWLCRKLGASFDRLRLEGGSVRIRLALPNGEVVVGTAETTDGAVASLLERFGGGA